ncbi:MAG: diphthine--ammonia ligase [Deltaproteobacteria bacterium]|nr:diphthine--ammonia ligase [Deltaproteobacteria bacterium]
MKSIDGHPFICSWSGGKDSCLALYHGIRAGGIPRFLLTMLREDGLRSMSHSIPASLFWSQAEALGISLVTRSASWANYETTFLSALHDFHTQGIRSAAFGDIDLDEHREWCERVCAAAHIEAYHPLWRKARRDILDEFIGLGFRAVIISIKDGVLDREFLGRTLDPEVIKEIEAHGADASGERGEYHTMVIDGPLFSSPVHFQMNNQIFHDGYWLQDISP